MQSSERWVILRNGEFHLARKEGDTWLTTDRSWPSFSTAKRAAEDIGQSISFQGAEVAEKDLHFFLNFGGGGHTWYGCSTLCGNTSRSLYKALRARPGYVCVACICP